MFDILVIDDEHDIGELIKDIIEDELNLKTEFALNSSSALEILKKSTPKIIILDIWLEGSDMDGLGLLKIIKNTYKDIHVIVISGHGNIETAVKAIKLGAYNFIEKPFKSEKLVITVKRTLENIELQQHNAQLNQQNDLASIVGKNKKIIEIKNKIANNIGSNARTIIFGEIGTGKEKIARLIHNYQNSTNKPFYKVNIENYSEKELDDILFGNADSTSIFEKAKRSTTYINDIAKLSDHLQRKLLNYLHNSNLASKIICGSTMSHKQLINDLSFNQNLLQRLSSVILEIPPLRERKQDIKLIVDYYINNFKKNYYIKNLKLNSEFYIQFLEYDWPGNILELKNFIENLLIKLLLNQDDLLKITEFSIYQNNKNTFESCFDKSLKDAKQLFEKKHIEFNLQRFDGNITHTAKQIGMERTALHKKIKELQIKSHN
jgi:two-component system nitrogen regulation response regulator NtrX